MQTKIFAPLFLLVVSMFFVSSCSKQESMPGTSGKQAQTKPRSPISNTIENSPLSDLFGKKWDITRTQTFGTDPQQPWGPALITTTDYSEGDYFIFFKTMEPEHCTGYRRGEPTEFKQVEFDYHANLETGTLVMDDLPPGEFVFTVEKVTYLDESHNRIRLWGTANTPGNIRTLWFLKLSGSPSNESKPKK